MTGLVAQSGGEPIAVKAKIWPLFFNTLLTGFYSWIALIIAGLVAWQVFPNILEMGDEEDRARAGEGVMGEDHDPIISREMEERDVRGRRPGLTELRRPGPLLR